MPAPPLSLKHVPPVLVGDAPSDASRYQSGQLPRSPFLDSFRIADQRPKHPRNLQALTDGIFGENGPRPQITGGCDDDHFLDPQTKVASPYCSSNARSNFVGRWPTRTTALPAQNARTAPVTIKGLTLVGKGQFAWAEKALGELSPDEAIVEVA